MNQKRGKLSMMLFVLIGCLLLAVLLSYLKGEGLFEKPSGAPVALTGHGAYAPVAIDGAVYFPTVTDAGLSYEQARRAQVKKGAPSLMSGEGTAVLPADYIQRLYQAFGKVSYTPDGFHDYDTHYLLLTPADEGTAVCGVVIRHNEQFYLGNLDCELTGTLLTDLSGALASLGIK